MVEDTNGLRLLQAAAHALERQNEVRISNSCKAKKDDAWGNFLILPKRILYARLETRTKEFNLHASLRVKNS